MPQRAVAEAYRPVFEAAKIFSLRLSIRVPNRPPGRRQFVLVSFRRCAHSTGAMRAAYFSYFALRIGHGGPRCSQPLSIRCHESRAHEAFLANTLDGRKVFRSPTFNGP
ncbi:unnamed protein product [Protopolystoma xenopodis]|uniref:Uncharacterized protein n=1 Tax=Protopolystoma xenopodis TaxID=117903 RepID=A0A3S5AJR1_9PLAT|nr:unnamed protein product [Protopolystoma xenopodis]